MVAIRNINNSYIGMTIIKIVSIPHISIIDGNYEQPGVYEAQLIKIKNSMKNVLDIIHSSWYSSYRAERGRSDTNIELRWESTAVKGQTFLANINLYLVIRQRCINRETSESLISILVTNIREQLHRLKYETEIYEGDGYSLFSDTLTTANTVFYGLGKRTDVINLDNKVVPYSLFFDKYTISENDFRQLIATLSNHPECVVVISLTPTIYTPVEADIITKSNTMLSNLTRGIQQPDSTVVAANAQKVSEIFSYYSENLRSSLFFFSIYILARRNEADIIKPIIASQFRCGVSNLNIQDLTGGLHKFWSKDIDFLLPWIANNGISYNMRQNRQFSNTYRLPWTITSEEAVELAYFPIGSPDTSAGLKISESTFTAKEIRKGLVCGEDDETRDDMIIGKLRGANNNYLKMPLGDMAKHMFVAGTPGMGKSEFSTGVVHRLYEKGIPFLIIEPAKNEYRALSAVIPDLQVFTPGKEHISPFIGNLFMPPENVVLSSYKSTLKTFFEAAVSTSETLGVMFSEAIDLAYAKFGWLNHHTPAEAKDNGAKVFSLSDFIKCFEEIFASRNYSEKNRDLLVAGTSRLSKLLRYFDSYNSIPVSDLLGHPTVIELNGIEHELDKGIIMCYLLLIILSYVNSNWVADGKFRQCILLEEAHVLLDTNRQKIEGQVDPAAVAKQLILRMLKELRSVGLGFIIADQSPSAVGSDVVAMTGSKVTFKIVESADRQILANSMGLDPIKTDRIVRFLPGQAMFISPLLSYSEEIQTPLYKEKHNIPISISDTVLKERRNYWNDPNRRAWLMPYPECDRNKKCTECNTCNYKVRNLASQISEMILKSHREEFKNKADFENFIASLTASDSYIRYMSHEKKIPGLVRCVKIFLARKYYFTTKNYPNRNILMKIINRKIN